MRRQEIRREGADHVAVPDPYGTGEAITIAASSVPSFKASKALRDAVG